MECCLIFHGFTGSPAEVEPLATHLRSLGHAVHTPTLTGHGGTRQDMKQASWKDWVAGAESVLAQLLAEGKVVHIAGFSMGGLIAAHLAAKYPVRSLTMLSSPIYYVNKKQIVQTVTETIKQRVRERRLQSLEWARERERYWAASRKDVGKKDTSRYVMKVRITPLKAVLNFQQLVRHLKTDLQHVNVPTLIIQGEKDDLVQTRSAWYIYNTIQSRYKKIHFFSESRHMICLGCDQEKVCRLVADFINSSRLLQYETGVENNEL